MKNSVGEKAAQPQNQPLKLTKYLFKDKLWLQKYSALLENKFRKTVREEADLAIERSLNSGSRPLPGLIEQSGRKYKLQFERKLTNKLFTGNKVEAEGSSPLKVLLLDAVSGHPIKDGPLSSKKVEIVVLEGHFNAEQLEEWTNRDFCSHMVSKSRNKGSLLGGECMITLHNGVGFVNHIFFLDNSCWVRTKMFRLGARVVAEEDQVMEAVSSPVKVKARRGESYEKHDIPSLDDEVWRLYGIAKDGKICKKLEENQIYKVKDFITKYQTDETLLRRIVGDSTKRWKKVIQHANSCFSAYAGSETNNLAQNSIPFGSAGLDMNDLAQNSIPFGNTISPISISFPDLQQFCAPVQQEVPAVRSMALDNALQENSYISSLVDAGLPSLGYSVPSSSTTMLNDESIWNFDPPMWDAGV